MNNNIVKNKIFSIYPQKEEVYVFNKILHGTHLAQHENTAECVPVRMPAPKTVTIPMAMNIGKPAVPVVKPGDTVKIGQLIAEPGGFVSAPIHTGVCGKVKKIDDILMFTGQYSKAIVIECDEVQDQFEEMAPVPVTDLKSFVDAVKASGVIGLGGAGFPTGVKLDVDPEKVDYICVNGAECEPFVTADTRTMMDDYTPLLNTVKLLNKFYSPKKIIIGIEDNKPQCVKKLSALVKEDSELRDAVDVRSLPPLYPQGGEKVLIHNTTGRIVPEGKLPIDVGCIVINTSTCAIISRYITTGMPLVRKYITVDGSAIKNPMNVIAPVGTSIRDIIEFTGGFKSEPGKVVLGGPMMGVTAVSLDAPVVKNTGAVLAFDEKDSKLPEPSACIRCGRCIDTCPANLMPTEIERAYEKRDGAELKKLKVNLCMECGCCSYVCPGKHRLVETNKLAKGVLNAYLAQQKAEAEKKAAKQKEKEENAK